MTPTQLRAFSAVVRHGSVKDAAAELGVTEAAVSLHVGQLRRELEDQLFTRTSSGLAFTPGGLRLASRATEMLGLQDRTILEVSQAGHGRRLMRVAATSLFAEHAAPGLIELFAGRADDLDVELTVAPPARFAALLLSRNVDMAIGPQLSKLPEPLVQKPFLNYQIVLVAAKDHPSAAGPARPSHAARADLAARAVGRPARRRRGRRWSASSGCPRRNQRIFQSHAAALEEAQRGAGVALGVSFAVAGDLANGPAGPDRRRRGCSAAGGWAA